jgi:hypothetical protein
LNGRDDLVAALPHLIADRRSWMQRGAVIKTIINGMTFDGATKDPVQKAVRDALIAFMAGDSTGPGGGHQGGTEGRHQGGKGS